MMRFHSQHQAALGLIRAGRLGRPVYARAQLSCWYPPLERAWRQDPVLGGGGSLVDLGSHLLDLLEMFFGPIAKVSCFINNLVHHYRSEDGAIAMLWFQSGALGAIDAFFSIRDESTKNMLELYGSHGSILASGTIGQESAGTMSAYFEHGAAGDGPREAQAVAEWFPIAAEPVNIYRAEIEEFSQALLERRPSGLAGDAGLRNQRLLAACYESARTGRVVPAAGPDSGGAGDVKSMGPP